MTQEEFYDEYLEDDYIEKCNLQCPKCGREYDEIDYEFQCCSKCGWDSEEKKWTKMRQPTSKDFMNGDADILTGQWY